MNNLTEAYTNGLERLAALFDKNEPAHAEALIYQNRLWEVVEKKKHGDTPQLQHDLSILLDDLEMFSLRTTNKSFINDHCGLGNRSPSPKPPPQSDDLFLLAVSTYCTTMLEAARVMKVRLEQPETLYPNECNNLRDAFYGFEMPFHSETITTMQQSTKVLFISDQVKHFIALLDAYCPVCHKPSRKQRESVHIALKTLIEYIER
jgi:hypothetical protein